MEIERAVATSGEYRLHSSYCHLGFSPQKWYRMSEDQRRKKIEKFFHTPLSPNLASTGGTAEQNSENPLDDLKLPQHMATTVWSRAQKLVTDSDGMVCAPGKSDAWMVKSLSGSKPHYVVPSKGGGYCCDDTCLAYKSAKICSHTTAAALKCGRIQSLVHWHNHKSQPNLTVLAESGKPAGVGTKHKRKGVSKQTSRQVHMLLSDAAESDFTYRVPCEGMGRGSSSPPSTSPSLPATNFCPSIQVQQGLIPITASELTSISVTCPSVQVVRSPPPLVPVAYNSSANVSQHRSPLPQPSIQVYNPTPIIAGIGSLTQQQLVGPSPLTAGTAERPPVTNPFWICFIHGNISRCNGCKGKILRGEDRKPLPPPDDLVLRHKEFVLFSNPRTGLFEQSREERNVYYHPWKTCVAPHFSHFNPAVHLRVDGSVQERFLPSHLSHIQQEFGLVLLP